MPSFWRILLTIFFAVVLGFLLWQSPPKELSDLLSSPQQTPSHPETYLIGARIKQFDEEGRLSYILEADVMRYFDVENESQPEMTLDQPNITLFKKGSDKEPWEIESSTAEGSEKKDELILIGNVVIEQTLTNGNKTRLETNELTIKPNRRYAETDKPVIIKDRTGTVRSTGVKVFFDDERIELLSNTIGDYKPR
ncbi:MAG: LPS export ABC transporter periplasmic protein LptC [Cellvibrionaceae bacterium]